MKLKKLNIDSFRHLENLKFDFTYPEDFHIIEKRGKPLDKICIIGQSATGKTSLLELIYEELSTLQHVSIDESKKIFSIENDTNLHNCELEVVLNNEVISVSKNDLKLNNILYKDFRENLTSGVFGYPFLSKFKTFYFKSNLISEKNVSILDLNPLELREIFSKLKKGSLKSINTIIFSEEIDNEIWYHLLNEINEFHSKRYQKFTDLIGKGLIANLDRFNYEVQQFLETNPNPVEKFGKKFNLLLEKLHLEIDYNNTEFSIPIKNKRKNDIISIQNISTGTKGLLLSFLPLYQLETKNTIILVDEPERSLYPDIQMELISFYQKIAPDAQFIVATHSPFVAAAFEPCERFILYFDENGEIKTKRGVSPIGDDPNDILKQDFGLEFLMNAQGLRAFEKFKSLKKELSEEKNESKKANLLNEILTLANAYKF